MTHDDAAVTGNCCY